MNSEAQPRREDKDRADRGRLERASDSTSPYIAAAHEALQNVLDGDKGGFLLLETRMRGFPVHNPLVPKAGRPILASKEQHAEVLTRIWGTSEDNDILSANALQHACIFCIPQIMAAAHHMQPSRYRGDGDFHSHTMGTAMGMAECLLQLPQDSTTSLNPAVDIVNHHLPHADGEKWLHMPASGKGGARIPHTAMGYALYEMMRAGEHLARARGTDVTSADELAHFAHFREILQRTGFHCPDAREDMERVAAVARHHRKVHTSTYRYFLPRQKDPLTAEAYLAFLRPCSRAVFAEAMEGAA